MKTAKMTFIAVMLMLFTACSSDLSREQRSVRKAAEKCYEYLQDGKYDKFVGEIAYADSMSEDYRSQMVDLIKEFAASEKLRHGKLMKVEAIGEDIKDSLAQVYLQISYADSTSEEVGVPMVKIGKRWKMQ